MVFGAVEQVQGGMADGGHVLWGVIGSYTRSILMEDDIQRPVQCIFDGPVRPHGMSDLACVGGQAADEKAPLGAGVSIALARFFDHGDAAQSGPVRLLLQPVQLLADHTAARLHAPVARIALGVGVLDGTGVGFGRFRLQKQAHVCVQCALVALEGEHVVRPFVLNLLRNAALAAHRICGDGVPRHIHQIKQCRDGRDLVGFVRYLLLAQHQARAAGVRTDHVDGAGVRRIPDTPAATATHRLAVQRDDLCRQRVQRCGPGNEAGAKLLGVYGCTHPRKGVLARDARLKRIVLTQQIKLVLPERHKVPPALGTADGAAQQHKQNFLERVQLGAFHPRIRHLPKMLLESVQHRPSLPRIPSTLQSCTAIGFDGGSPSCF